MENKELQLVTFEQAKRLKEAGFDWDTRDFYKVQDEKIHNWGIPYKMNHNDGRHPNYISASTVSLALKWMRDVKGMFGIVSIFFVYDEHGMPYDELRYGVEALNQSRTTIVDLDDYGHNGAFGYPTYEAAESVLLDEILTLIEK